MRWAHTPHRHADATLSPASGIILLGSVDLHAIVKSVQSLCIKYTRCRVGRRSSDGRYPDRSAAAPITLLYSGDRDTERDTRLFSRVFATRERNKPGRAGAALETTLCLGSSAWRKSCSKFHASASALLKVAGIVRFCAMSKGVTHELGHFRRQFEAA